jgi:hypothetical protein
LFPQLRSHLGRSWPTSAASWIASTNAIFPAAHAEIIILSNLQTADLRTITERLAVMTGLQAR